MFSRKRAGREQNRIRWSGIIILSVRNQEEGQSDDESPAKIAIRLGGAGEKVKQQASEPERKTEWIHHQNLLADICERRIGDVLASDAYVVHQLEKGPVLLDVPNQIRKEEQERNGPASKKPRREQKLALFGEEKSEKQGERKDRNGVFVFEAQASNHAESDPEFWILRVHHSQNHV